MQIRSYNSTEIPFLASIIYVTSARWQIMHLLSYLLPSLCIHAGNGQIHYIAFSHFTFHSILLNVIPPECCEEIHTTYIMRAWSNRDRNCSLTGERWITLECLQYLLAGLPWLRARSTLLETLITPALAQKDGIHSLNYTFKSLISRLFI